MAELTTQDQLTDLFGSPPAIVLAKTIDHLDAGARSWLQASTLMVASIADADDLTISLGGAAPGWADGDEATLRLPTAALDAPTRFTPGAGFGSIFLVPSVNELMRLNGRIRSNDGTEVCVTVEACFIHCGKALIRSDFWSTVPTTDDLHTPQQFAQHSRFIGLASCNARYQADLSPKGDPAGAMVHLDRQALRFADRPGNRRIDSFRNLIEHPRVAASLLVPGSPRLLLVQGVARITDDLAEREHFAVQDKVPGLVTVIGDLRTTWQTSPALERTAAWRSSKAPPGLSAGKIASGHLKLGKRVGARLAGVVMSIPGLVEREMARDYKKNLY